MGKHNSEKIVAEEYNKKGYLVIINGQPDIIAVKDHGTHGEIIFDEVKKGQYAYLRPNQERAATILRKLEGKPVYLTYKLTKLSYNVPDSVIIEKNLPVCTRCETSDPRKSGFNHKGKQRYQCKSCGYNFISPKDRIGRTHQPTGHTCQHCNSPNTTWHGRTFLSGNREKRRLKCKDCGRSCYPLGETVCVFKEPVCPECESNDYWKAGFTSLGQQKFKCTSCGRNYIRPEERRLIKSLILF